MERALNTPPHTPPRDPTKRYCISCNKALRPFKKTCDWQKRQLHKKCWKEL